MNLKTRVARMLSRLASAPCWGGRDWRDMAGELWGQGRDRTRPLSPGVGRLASYVGLTAMVPYVLAKPHILRRRDPRITSEEQIIEAERTAAHWREQLGLRAGFTGEDLAAALRTYAQGLGFNDAEWARFEARLPEVQARYAERVSEAERLARTPTAGQEPRRADVE